MKHDHDIDHGHSLRTGSRGGRKKNAKLKNSLRSLISFFPKKLAESRPKENLRACSYAQPAQAFGQAVRDKLVSEGPSSILFAHRLVSRAFTFARAAGTRTCSEPMLKKI